MRNYWLAFVFLLTSVVSGQISSQQEISSSPDYTNCVSTQCKAKNEWTGGTAGVRADIQIRNSDACNLPECTYSHKGIWAKIASTGRYLGVVEEENTAYPVTDSRRRAYWAQRYIPGSGLLYLSLGTVESADYNNYGTFRITWNPDFYDNRACVENLPGRGALCYYALDNTLVWDVAIIGFRIQSAPDQGSLNVFIDQFNITQNQWQLSTNLNWYYQTANGTLSNSAPDWLTHYWFTYPSSSSVGGVYKGYCYCP